MPVTPASRAKILPDEYKVKNGLLFCKWCDKSIHSLRMDNLHGHIQSDSHQSARMQQGAKMSFDPHSKTRLKFLEMRKRKKERAKMKKVEADAEEGLRQLFSNSDSEDTESFQGFDDNGGVDPSERKFRRHSSAALKKKNNKQRRFSVPNRRNKAEESDDWTSPNSDKEKVSYSARRSRTSYKQGSLKIKISRKSKSQSRVHERSRSQDSSRSVVKERSRSFHAKKSSEYEESDASEKNVQIQPCGDTLKLKFVLNKTKHQEEQQESDFVDEVTSENEGSEKELQEEEVAGSENEQPEIEHEEEVIEEEIVEMGDEEFDTWEAIGPFTDEEKAEEEEEIVSSIPPPPVLKEPMTQEETLAIKANHARQMAKSVNSAQFAKKAQKKPIAKNQPQSLSGDKMKGRRISGYNMWASNIRRQIGSQFPGMQFGDVSKRVGDLWKKLPDKEKKMWKHKSMKMYQEQLRKMENSSATKRKQGSKMIETGPKKKAAISSSPSKKAKIVSTEPKRAYVQQSKRQSILKSPARTPPSQQQKDSSTSMSPPHKNPAQLMERDLQKLPPPPIALMDAAAHFALLGETLSTIGNKVANLGNKYSGNIVVPLMLDSFMCSITPLLSLTNQVPGLQDSIHPKTVSDTLANVHNFMPGI